MVQDNQIGIVLVGRELTIRPLEDVLMRHGATNYICVPSLDAADWLICGGFRSDVLIIHHELMKRTADVAKLRRSCPHAIILSSSAANFEQSIRTALLAASCKTDAEAIAA